MSSSACSCCSFSCALLRTQVSSIALAGAGKILGREIDAKAHSDLLDKLVAEI